MPLTHTWGAHDYKKKKQEELGSPVTLSLVLETAVWVLKASFIPSWVPGAFQEHTTLGLVGHLAQLTAEMAGGLELVVGTQGRSVWRLSHADQWT